MVRPGGSPQTRPGRQSHRSSTVCLKPTPKNQVSRHSLRPGAPVESNDHCPGITSVFFRPYTVVRQLLKRLGKKLYHGVLTSRDKEGWLPNFHSLPGRQKVPNCDQYYDTSSARRDSRYAYMFRRSRANVLPQLAKMVIGPGCSYPPRSLVQVSSLGIRLCRKRSVRTVCVRYRVQIPPRPLPAFGNIASRSWWSQRPEVPS